MGATKSLEAGIIPLIVPITLIRHCMRKYCVGYRHGQIYVDPHPRELMLRNHGSAGRHFPPQDNFAFPTMEDYSLARKSQSCRSRKEINP